MDNELSEPIYENYDEDLQAFNGTLIFRQPAAKNILKISG